MKHRLLERTFLPILASLLAPGVFCPGSATAGPSPEIILFDSQGVRIVRMFGPDGTPVTVVTNLDPEGNRLAGPPPEDTLPRPSAGGASPMAPCGDASRGEGPGPSSCAESARPAGVRVVVNGTDTAGNDDGRVEVTTDGSGATTVIVNVNPPPAPAPEPLVLLSYPANAVITGGIVGGFRYPDPLFFLGYGPGTASPSWLGGLGLNAGNRFGLSSGGPCERGFDCMFAPTGRRASPDSREARP